MNSVPRKSIVDRLQPSLVEGAANYLRRVMERLPEIRSGKIHLDIARPAAGGRCAQSGAAQVGVAKGATGTFDSPGPPSPARRAVEDAVEDADIEQAQLGEIRAREIEVPPFDVPDLDDVLGGLHSAVASPVARLRELDATQIEAAGLAPRHALAFERLSSR
ncbi:MAG TPA: hypothetical protein VLW85_20810 [Myxococcales bacterium]|nr:hypothetical protein [Myxococcales bacterium]